MAGARTDSFELRSIQPCRVVGSSVIGILTVPPETGSPLSAAGAAVLSSPASLLVVTSLSFALLSPAIVSLALLLPHAAKDMLMVTANTTAINFFILLPPSYYYLIL